VLVAFWEVTPLGAGDSHFTFEDAWPFQQLFTVAAELSGLKDKMAATGYALPDIGTVGAAPDDADRPYRVRGEKKMHTLPFRSRESILQSNEPDLVRDVCRDIRQGSGKLERMRAHIDSLREYVATELQMLTEVDAKLSAALVAALLSTQRR
jgi:hypothetical protein